MPKIVIVGSIAGSLVSFRGDLIKEWLKCGFAVTALTRPTDKQRKSKIEALGAKHRVIPLYRDGINPIQDLKLIYRLYRVFQEEKPDYIFTYTVKPIIYSALCARFSCRSSLFAMITGLGYAFTGDSVKQRLVKGLLRFFYRKALKRYDTVFFQNQDDLALFRMLKLISKEQRVIMVNGSGVNLDYYYYKEPSYEQSLTFLLIARLIKSKGIKEYVEAAGIIKKRHPNLIIKFLLVGRLLDAPDSIDLQELNKWQEEGLIDYPGGVRDVRPFIEECSVYVLPTYYREGMPRSILEAMSMGRPIITTDAPGCRETVEVGVNGFLVPAKDIDALANTMERFIKEPRLVMLMGKESRRIAEDKFDVHKVNRIILEAMSLNVEVEVDKNYNGN